MARHGHWRGGGIVAAPPAAAEGLEQSRSIGETHHLRLHQRELCRLVHLLGTQDQVVSDRAGLQFGAGDLEILPRHIIRDLRRLQLLGIRLQRAACRRRSERTDHRLLVHRGGIVELRQGGALSVFERTAVEQRRGQPGGHVEELVIAGKSVSDGGGRGAELRRQRELRQAVGEAALAGSTQRKLDRG